MVLDKYTSCFLLCVHSSFSLFLETGARSHLVSFLRYALLIKLPYDLLSAFAARLKLKLCFQLNKQINHESSKGSTFGNLPVNGYCCH